MGFPYQPLDAATPSIGLLKLQRGDWDDDICCELHSVRLDEATPSEALSYVWGNATHVRQIRLHGHVHGAASNLETALRHLRHQTEAHTLWIDALCINQEDLEGRQSQVQIMNEVCRSAATVIRWLSEATSDSDE